MHGIHKSRKLHIRREIFVYGMHWCVCPYVCTYTRTYIRTYVFFMRACSLLCAVCLCSQKCSTQGMGEAHRCVINIRSAQK